MFVKRNNDQKQHQCPFHTAQSKDTKIVELKIEIFRKFVEICIFTVKKRGGGGLPAMYTNSGPRGNFGADFPRYFKVPLGKYKWGPASPQRKFSEPMPCRTSVTVAQILAKDGAHPMSSGLYVVARKTGVTR